MSSQTVGLPGFEIEKRLVLSGSGLGLQQLLQAGSHWLARHVEQVNRVNVFPVPDGDTGTNMLLTMQAAVEAATQVANPSASDVATAAADGALFGGRGNSGLILSQFLQGLAAGLTGKEIFTVLDLAAAINLGAKQAYRSVPEPVEGTILTIARAAAQAAAHSAGVSADLAELLAGVVAASMRAQTETPRLLPVLAEAGVTDSGGLGLLYIFEGMLRFLDQSPDDAPSITERLTSGQVRFSPNGHIYGYDVQFFIQGAGLPVERIQTDLSQLGDSSLIIDSAKGVKVHVHASDPDQIVRRAEQFGQVVDLLVEDMTGQAREFAYSRLDSRVYNDNSAPTTLITLVAGAGLVEIFRGDSLVVEQLEALATAIEQTPAAQVLILPTAAATIVAIQEIAAMAQKPVAVVPITSVPQALAALLAFNSQLDLTTNARHLVAAAQRVRTISLSPATQTDTERSVIWEATLDSQLVATNTTVDEATLAALALVSADDFDLVTIYFGAAVTLLQAARLACCIEALYPNVELDVVNGEQPQPYYIIALE